MYERELKRFFRQAAPELKCGRAQRQVFQKCISSAMQDYLEAQPEASFEEVREALGAPEEAAREFMRALPQQTAENWRKARRRRNYILIALTAALVAVLAALVIWYYCVKGVFTKTVTIIDYGDSIAFEAMPTAAPIEE